MEIFDKIAYRTELKARLRKFALKLIELSQHTPFKTESKVLINQLLRSGTSVYANYSPFQTTATSSFNPLIFQPINLSISTYEYKP